MAKYWDTAGVLQARKHTQTCLRLFSENNLNGLNAVLEVSNSLSGRLLPAWNVGRCVPCTHQLPFHLNVEWMLLDLFRTKFTSETLSLILDE